MEYADLVHFLALQRSATMDDGKEGTIESEPNVWVSQYMAEQPEDSLNEDGSPFNQRPYVEEFVRKALTWRAMLASSSNADVAAMASRLPVLLTLEAAEAMNELEEQLQNELAMPPKETAS